ncbi:MAG: type I phosphomannose isomerase catalytic subunit [Planctomycetota bacterium]
MRPYPLVLTPILIPKVWGGRALAALGKPLPPGEPIGESWELADLASTSKDGAGGDAARSTIANGGMRGLTLADAITAMGDNLMGDLRLTESGGFPLLLKYLDARTNLSVQVHPSPAYADRHPEVHLKTESWYIVDAQPDAVLYLGLREGLTKGDLERAIGDGSVGDLLIRVPARAGDCHTLPSGTLHALGGGVLVAEVQTPSDTTFRVFDWGREGRTLHVEQALACTDLGPLAPEHSKSAMDGGGLASTRYYTIERERWMDPTTVAFDAHRPSVLMCLDGAASLEHGEGETTGVRKGDTVLLPSSVDTLTIAPDGVLEALVVEFPDA